MRLFIRKPGADYHADEVWADNLGYTVVIPDGPYGPMQFSMGDYIVAYQTEEDGLTVTFMFGDFFERTFAPCHSTKKLSSGPSLTGITIGGGTSTTSDTTPENSEQPESANTATPSEGTFIP